MINREGLQELVKGIQHFLMMIDDPIYPTPPLRQDMTQGQFF